MSAPKWIIFRPEFVDVHAGAGLYLNVEDVIVPEPDDAVIPQRSVVPAASGDLTDKERAFAARDGGIWIPVPEPHDAVTRVPRGDGQGLMIVPDPHGASANEVIRAIFAWYREVGADAATEAREAQREPEFVPPGVSRVCGNCHHFGKNSYAPGAHYGCGIVEGDVGTTNEKRRETATWFTAFVDSKTGTLNCAAENCPGFAERLPNPPPKAH